MLDLSNASPFVLETIKQALLDRIAEQERFIKEHQEKKSAGVPFYYKVCRNPLKMKSKKKPNKKTKSYARFVFCHEFTSFPHEIIERTQKRIDEIDKVILDRERVADQ